MLFQDWNFQTLLPNNKKICKNWRYYWEAILAFIILTGYNVLLSPQYNATLICRFPAQVSSLVNDLLLPKGISCTTAHDKRFRYLKQNFLSSTFSPSVVALSLVNACVWDKHFHHIIKTTLKNCQNGFLTLALHLCFGFFGDIRRLSSLSYYLWVKCYFWISPVDESVLVSVLRSKYHFMREETDIFINTQLPLLKKQFSPVL